MYVTIELNEPGEVFYVVMLASDTRVPSLDEVIAANSKDPDLQVMASASGDMFVSK